MVERNVNLIKEHETLVNEHETLKKDYASLSKKYDETIDELKKINTEIESIKKEYSENTIIQSMNDMKDRYNELIRTTVSIYKYRELESKYFRLYRCNYSMLSLINHIKKLVNELESQVIYDRANAISRIKNDLLTMQDIIEDVIEEQI